MKRHDTTTEPLVAGRPMAEDLDRRPLSVIAKLFTRMHEEQIRYCHWKSNVRLPSSMVGATDLDILVERRSTSALRRVFAQLDIKRFAPASYRSYPGVESHLAYDSATGQLVHIHTHFQLTLGEKLLKGHRLPWEQLMLATRVLDETHHVYVADPNLELIVLAVRTALKFSARDLILTRRRRRYLGRQTEEEFRWLAARSDWTRVHQLATGLIGEGAAERLPKLVRTPSFGHLLSFRRSAAPVLNGFRLYGRIRTRTLTLAREVALRARGWRRSTHIPGFPRTLPQGGITVAIVGEQREAQTKLITALERWLARDVAVLTPRAGGQLEHDTVRRATGHGVVVLMNYGAELPLGALNGSGDQQTGATPDLVFSLSRPSEASSANHIKDKGCEDEGHIPLVIELDPADRWEDLLLRAKCAVWRSL